MSKTLFYKDDFIKYVQILWKFQKTLSFFVKIYYNIAMKSTVIFL